MTVPPWVERGICIAYSTAVLGTTALFAAAYLYARSDNPNMVKSFLPSMAVWWEACAILSDLYFALLIIGCIGVLPLSSARGRIVITVGFILSLAGLAFACSHW